MAKYLYLQKWNMYMYLMFQKNYHNHIDMCSLKTKMKNFFRHILLDNKYIVLALMTEELEIRHLWLKLLLLLVVYLLMPQLLVLVQQ
ncbi:MAG: hypothetical protein EBR82_21960 [Caulobacteraceae bacterium]|nr:hypothetical protein [Caulobacteraceae bacterium]